MKVSATTIKMRQFGEYIYSKRRPDMAPRAMINKEHIRQYSVLQVHTLIHEEWHLQ